MTAYLREVVEQCHTHLQLHHLALKRACHHPLAQPLEAVHLGLDQPTPVYKRYLAAVQNR